MEQHTAKPTWISEILNANFIQQEDGPSTIELQDGTIAHKIRIYGIIVSTDEIVVDDGTGSILVRTFETNQKTTLGDPVIVIGKPRTYNNQPYILGEIVKKIDPKWMELRKKQKKQNPLEIVKELDKGEGADYNEVITKIGNNGEEIIVSLLAKGDLFETRPGKLKVLE